MSTFPYLLRPASDSCHTSVACLPYPQTRIHLRPLVVSLPLLSESQAHMHVCIHTLHLYTHCTHTAPVCIHSTCIHKWHAYTHHTHTHTAHIYIAHVYTHSTCIHRGHTCTQTTCVHTHMYTHTVHFSQ